MLINYVAPEVIGFTSGVNQFIADYVKENPKRLISCGVASRNSTNILADVEQILRLDIRMIKLASTAVSQRIFNGRQELEIIYRAAKRGCRSCSTPAHRYLQGRATVPGSVYIDDVAVDFRK